MHSITESDGVPSDPYEVLCHMAALIIEGRTPLHVSKGIGDGGISGETVKSVKPYHEGPHCPNFAKAFNKDSPNAHKCSESSVACIRFGKLKQHLLHLFEKSVPISIQVSLGPDCLCGELRSQSTLVSGTPSKRDILLEQWTIAVNGKRGHEHSQMSVMNLYQAVRSLLHFSQLAAWYTTNKGTKPANVIYRVGVPGDDIFVAGDNFVKHNFPVADVDKGVSMKISVKSAPRVESIPSVYCPQHSCGHPEGAYGLHQEGKEFSRSNKEKKCHKVDEKDEVPTLPLKFQGVRKKIYKSQEGKGRSRISYFGSSTSFGADSSRPEIYDCLEYLDEIAQEKKSPAAKSKGLPGAYGSLEKTSTVTYFTDLVLPDTWTDESPKVDFHSIRRMRHVTNQLHAHPPAGLSCTSPTSEVFARHSTTDDESIFPKSHDFVNAPWNPRRCGDGDGEGTTMRSDESRRFTSRKCDKRNSRMTAKSPKRAGEIVDDRMQISCGISGKHHCKCEYEEETYNAGVEKPRRRRSLGKGSTEIPCSPTIPETDGIMHGKFKDVVDSRAADRLRHADKPSTLTLKTIKRAMQSESSKWTSSDFPVKKKSLTEKVVSVLPPAHRSTAVPDMESALETPDVFTSDAFREVTPTKTETIDQVGEMEKKSCGEEASYEFLAERVNKTDRDSGLEWQAPVNPFMAAILKTTNKCCKLAVNAEVPSRRRHHCDNNSQINNLYDSELRCDAKFERNSGGDVSATVPATFIRSTATVAPIAVPVDDVHVDNADDDNHNGNSDDDRDRICGYSLYKKKVNNDDDVIVINSEEKEEKREEDDAKVMMHPRPLPSNITDESDKKMDSTITSFQETTTGIKPPPSMKLDFFSGRGDRSRTPCIRSKHHRLHLDAAAERKLSAVRNLSNIGSGDCDSVSGRSSQFFTKSLTRLKSLFDKREDCNLEESGGEESSATRDSDTDVNGNNNGNGSKTIPVPSAQEKLKFRRSLDSAAQLVFHRCSGLPLTSSPAPVRRNNSSFTFDSSLNSVSAIKSALFDSVNSASSEDENESEGSLRSPASPGACSIGSKSINYHSLSPLPLLGTFEESVLNGRLEPVSTVQGFTAELGASGSFCPRHLCLPVTVFFYTLGDNDKVSAPYLGHINLGRKGYNVPRSGTIQVTLFNPLRTVVKMFVVVYDLHDMPPNSHTFLRQRTLYVPASQKELGNSTDKSTPFEHEDYHKYLRYLIHLRFISGKSGRIYLHTDIRMVIFRKADEDTATALGRQVDGETFELRSHTHGPTNPKFSPRK